jgi:TRAP-type C4-dicarboxylate transport system permease small subunit
MSSLFNFLERIDGYLVTMEKGLIIFVLFLLIVFSFGQVVARNVFKVGYMWIDELTRVIVLWMAFIGGALCSEYARHMRIYIVLHLVKGVKKRVIEIIGNVFVIVICSFLLLASINHIKYQMESSVQLMLQGVPDWMVSLVIPYFFIVTILRALLRIKKDILDEEQLELPEIGSSNLNGESEQALQTK